MCPGHEMVKEYSFQSCDPAALNQDARGGQALSTVRTLYIYSESSLNRTLRKPALPEYHPII
jgi:hypothetical protein